MDIKEYTEKIVNLNRLNDHDKHILINTLNCNNIDLCKNMTIFSNKGIYFEIDKFKYYEINNPVFYIKNMNIFIDEDKKILFNSNYKFHHLKCLIDILETLLIFIDNINLKQSVIINEKIIACEKWYYTYGHLTDEIFKICYVKNNYFKEHIPFFDSPIQNNNINYKNNNVLLISDIIFNNNYINSDNYNKNILQFNSIILLQHRFCEKSFHFFPIEITKKILQYTELNTIKKKYNPKVFITRGIALHMKRNLNNQEELEKYFLNKNFEIINPENENFYDFVNILQNATTVIITWGGALTNLIYLKENTNVFILKSDSYLHENICLFQKIIDTYKLNVTVINSVNNEIKDEIILNEINKKEKTLIGKNNYLFLHNDSSKEIDFHLQDKSFLNMDYVINHSKYKNSILIIFPDKSVLCKNYLPDELNNIQRTTVFHLKNELNNIFDSYDCLKKLDNVFYKTDTHLNLCGCYETYKNSLIFFNSYFNQNIILQNIEIKEKIVENLSSVGVGIGDLTWPNNLGSQTLENTEDTYFYSDDIEDFYCKYKITQKNIYEMNFYDYNHEKKTEELINQIINWDILSKYIIETVNVNTVNNIKVLFFYDSFLISTLILYMKTFKHCIFVKSSYDLNLVLHYNCDYVLEYRVERFLNKV